MAFFVRQTARIQAFLPIVAATSEVQAVFMLAFLMHRQPDVRTNPMINKALLLLEAVILLFGMLAFQACFEEEPYRYAPPYGHPYEYGYGGGYGYERPFWGNHEEHEEHEHNWHHEDDD
jgi:hypothetical protein